MKQQRKKGGRQDDARSLRQGRDGGFRPEPSSLTAYAPSEELYVSFASSLADGTLLSRVFWHQSLSDAYRNDAWHRVASSGARVWRVF